MQTSSPSTVVLSAAQTSAIPHNERSDDEKRACDNVAKGTQVLCEYWDLHVPDELCSLFHDVRRDKNERHGKDYNDDDTESINQALDLSPKALVFWRATPPSTLISLLKNLIQTCNNDSKIISLEMSASVDTWLLPTCLSLLPRLERMIVRDPVLRDIGVSPRKFWPHVYQNLKEMNHLRFLSVEWTQPCEYALDSERDDTWLDILLNLPLEEYHHQGLSDVFSQRWTPAQVMRLLYHSTLQFVRIDCPLEAGEWPLRGEQAMWRLPKRTTPLRLVLPAISPEERKIVISKLPVRNFLTRPGLSYEVLSRLVLLTGSSIRFQHYVHIVPEGPIVATPPTSVVPSDEASMETDFLPL